MKEREYISKVIEFVSQMIEIRGKPEDVFPKVETLLKSYNLSTEPVVQLREISRYLDRYGIDWSRAEVDFGFGRGLAYYTGMIFEIHDTSGYLGAQRQICGGGRYDTLIGDLGGRNSIPALGFAFGLERLLLISDESILPGREPVVFVVAIGENEVIDYAVRTAKLLREKGVCVEFCSPATRSRRHTERANKLGMPFVIYVGEEEKTGGYVTLRYMASGEQKQCSATDAASLVLSGGAK
jgi:histidyl-tRNA synthetase